MAKFIGGVPAPLMKWHISVDQIKIGRKITFAKGRKFKRAKFS